MRHSLDQGPGLPFMSAADLIIEIDTEIEAAEARMRAFSERFALEREHIDDSDLATTQRCLDALRRTERFRGEHTIARDWLRTIAPEIGIFRATAK